MPFLTELVIRGERRTDKYILAQALVYDSPSMNEVYVAHAGFITDFASIPRRLRGFIDDDASYLRDAAVIHDWLYTSKEVKRITADKILQEAMLELGSGKIKAYLVYYAVRAFGGGHYAKN
jgi:hypothetical protein